MRAVACIIAAATTLALMGGANTRACAQSADLPIVNKAPKVRKDKAKPVKNPDKNQYWLLNPTPPDQMRGFNTDRPTKANVPYTVDAGHFQYETDLVNFTHQVIGSVRTNTILVPNPTFKVGVTNNADLEVNVAPFAGVHTFGTATDGASTIWGVSDTFVRAKVNLWGNDGGSSAAALIPYVKAPSAPIGIGNGAVEEGLIAPVALSLPKDFTLLLVPEIDAFKDSGDNGRHGNFILDINLSREVIKNVTAYVELWSDYNNDPMVKTTQISFDTAVSWIVFPNVQLDVGANFGLTSATPAVQVYTGLSQRY
jgi:Putative MetA-pathway of phenol degradation